MIQGRTWIQATAALLGFILLLTSSVLRQSNNTTVSDFAFGLNLPRRGYTQPQGNEHSSIHFAHSGTDGRNSQLNCTLSRQNTAPPPTARAVWLRRARAHSISRECSL